MEKNVWQTYWFFSTLCLTSRQKFTHRFCETQMIKPSFDRGNISGLFDIVMVAIYSLHPSLLTTMKPRDCWRDLVVPVREAVRDAAPHPSRQHWKRQTTSLLPFLVLESRINWLLVYWSSCLFNGDELCFSPQILSLASILIFLRFTKLPIVNRG